MDGREAAGQTGRLPAIDILRGLAILWVVVFHMWGDIKFFPGAPFAYYDAFVDHLRDGEGAWPTLTAFTDVLFRLGFQGVPLFMMISGLSLTIAAYRADGAMSWPRFLVQRLRKLLVPYWAGVGLTFSVMALIAWRQVTLHGGDFEQQFLHGVSISVFSRVDVDGGVVFASLALVPRLFRDEWFFAPQLALWFVALLLQYYLLFPLLFLLMRRAGVVPFLLLTFAITVGSNWWVIEHWGYGPEVKFKMVTGWAPFRMFEFTLGMALGWLLAAPEARRAHYLAARPLVVPLALALGLAVHTTGDLLIGRWSAGYWQSLALPLSTLGLGLLALPLLAARPGRLQLSVPARMLALVGVMSYAILIVSDAMRLVSSQIRLEGVSELTWWTFLIAIYVPVSVIIAWPLSRALGLMPRGPRAARDEPRVPELEPAPVPAIA